VWGRSCVAPPGLGVFVISYRWLTLTGYRIDGPPGLLTSGPQADEFGDPED